MTETRRALNDPKLSITMENAGQKRRKIIKNLDQQQQELLNN